MFERFRRDPRDFLLEHLPKGSEGLEVGTHEGDFAARILQVVQPSVLHLVDPWRYFSEPQYDQAWFGGKTGVNQGHMDQRFARVRRRFSSEIADRRVVIHRKDSAAAAEVIPDGSLDWAYIDGNHLYEYVIKDLELYGRKIRPGGFLAGDDYTAGGWWQGGVKRAVDELIGTQRFKVEVIQDGQYLLRIPL